MMRSRLAPRIGTPLSSRCSAQHDLKRGYHCELDASAPENQGTGSLSFISIAGAIGATGLALIPNLHNCPAQCYYERRVDGSEDRLARWAKSWERPKLGKAPRFHSKDVNPLLVRHLSRLQGDASTNTNRSSPAVLVPLSGKSLDLSYLSSQGLSVVGVEGISRPVLEFQAEHRCKKKGPLYEPYDDRPVCLKGFISGKNLSVDARGRWTESTSFEASPSFQGERPGFAFKSGSQGLGYYSDFPKVWQGRMVGREESRSELPIAIIQADFFSVTPELVDGATSVEGGKFDLAYDRGALSSVPIEARRSYVNVLSSLLNPGGRILLVATEYDQSELPYDPSNKRLNPPPFSISAKNLKALFPRSQWDIEELSSEPCGDPSSVPSALPAFQDLEVTDRVFLITKKVKPTSHLISLGAGAVTIGAALAVAGVYLGMSPRSG